MNRLNRWKKAAWVTVLALVALTVAAPAQVENNHKAEMLLQEARHRALMDGDLEQSIELCKKILAGHSNNRAAVAKALVQIGQCYEKLGRAEARKAYERVVKEFADQADVAAQARERLAGMERDNGKSAPTIRKIWGPRGTERELINDNYPLFGVTRGNDSKPSPNGRYIAYTNWGPPSIAIYDLTTGKSRDITDDGTWDGPPTGQRWGSNPIWSPDGRYVAYTWCFEGSRIDSIPDHYELRVVGIDGRKPRILYRTDSRQESVIPHDWSPDGKTILATTEPSSRAWINDVSSNAMLISVEDGSKRILKMSGQSLPPFGSRMFFSPDGRYIAYDVRQSNQRLAKRDIYLLQTDGNTDGTALVKHPADDQLLGWTPDGKRLLLATDRTGVNTMALIEVREGQAQGSPQSLRHLEAGFKPIGLTRDGIFYYNVRIKRKDVYTATVDMETGKVVVAPALVNVPIEGRATTPCWSPDGQYLAYISWPANAEARSITIRSLGNHQVREVKYSAQVKRITSWDLEWSPGGKSLLVGGYQKEPLRRALLELDARTGDVSIIAYNETNGQIWLPTWSPDGKSIFYQRVKRIPGSGISGVHILERNLETGKEREIAKDISFGSLRGRMCADFSLSPDGRRIAFMSQEEEDNSFTDSVLNVKSIAGGEATELFRMRKSITLQGWTPDGRYILFQTHEKARPGADVQDLWRIPAAGGEPQKIELPMKEITRLRVHPDGRQVAFDVEGLKLELWAMENFLPESKTGQ